MSDSRSANVRSSLILMCEPSLVITVKAEGGRSEGRPVALILTGWLVLTPPEGVPEGVGVGAASRVAASGSSRVLTETTSKRPGESISAPTVYLGF